MTRRIDETDLLGWIEGDLTPERRRVVSEALERDVALRARVEAMVSDRAALRSWAGAAPAPRGVVAGAIEEAERLSLLGEAPGSYKIAWYRRVRTYSIAAAVLFALGGAVIVMQMNPPSQPAPADERITMTAPVEPEAASAATANRMQIASADEASIPLNEMVETMDRRGVAFEDAANGVLSLPYARSGLTQMVGMQGGARVTSAAFSDALRLASVGRLTVRVQSNNPEAVEAALRRFGTSDDHAIEVMSDEPGGDRRYAIEMDRTECEFSHLIATLEQASPAECRTFFDVMLLPATAARSRSGLEQPRQVTGASPRVSIQVLIERDGGVSW